MRILVVGASGFIGQHLIERLAAHGDEVEGWGREATAPAHVARYEAVDLLQPETLPRPEAPWEAAVLLAGHSVPGAAFTDALAIDNVAMSIHALTHLARYAPGIRVLLASSAHVYSPAPEPIDENAALAPQGRYGCSKLLLETWARHAPLGLEICLVRMFNQVGSGMPSGLLAPDLLKRLEAGEDPLVLRSPDHIRDFTDVRDGAEAFHLLLRAQGELPKAINVCSGRGTPLSELARVLAKALGRTPELVFAPGEANRFVGNPRRLVELVSWHPQRTLSASIEALVAKRRG